MKRLLLLLALLCVAPLARSQSTQNFGIPIGTGVTLPASCVVPSLFVKTNGHVYTCQGNAFVELATGGGGGISGSGTANLVTKFTTSTVVGNSQVTDDGTHPTYSPLGFDVTSTGWYAWGIPNNTSTGTAASKIACDDGTGKAITCSHNTSTTNQPLGVAVGGVGQTPGTSGLTGICTLGFCTVVFDNAATAGHYAQSSTTIDGDLSDVGTTAPTNGQPYWFIATSNSGTGTTGIIRQLAPSELNAASTGGGGKSSIQVNGSNTQPVDNLNSTIPAAGANNLNIVWQSSNSGNTTRISAEIPYASPLAVSGGNLGLANANNNFVLAGPAPVSAGSAGFVQSVGNITTGSQTVTTVSITPASGNALVVQAMGGGCSGNFTITDNNGGSYTNLHINDDGTFQHVQVAVATNHNTGATIVTATASATCTNGIQIMATEYSGLAASPSEGASGFSVAQIAQIATTTATVTTTGTNDLLYMGMVEVCTADSVTILSGTKRFSQWTGVNNLGTGVWDGGAGAAGTYGATVSVPSCGGGTGSVVLVAMKTSGSTSGPAAYRKLVGNDLPSGTWYGVYQNSQSGKTAAIADTLITSPVAVQNFRFTGTVNCTTTSASATATLNLKYTDTASTAQTVSVTDTCTALVTSGVPNLNVGLRAKAGTNITWGVTIANTPTYDVDVSLEARAP